jgi:raffinose/stachyose/melibiose transport system permease protein
MDARARIARLYRRKHIAVFLAPAVLVYSVFAIYPLLDSLRLSLYSGVDGGGLVFVGLRNFIYMFTDDNMSARFWGAFVNNVQFFAIHLLVQNPVGLLIAAVLTSGHLGRGRGLYRTIIFIPTTLSVVIVGFIWRLILSPLWGLVETPLLGLQETALPTLSLMSVWQYVGIPMVFFYSVLVGIPTEVLEAARVDGASGWQTFWRVKFPLLAPMFGIVSVITYIANFNAFDLIFAIQGALGTPNFSTDIFGTLFYRTLFGTGTQLGSMTLAAAVATLMFVIILLGVALYFFTIHRRLQTYEF